MKRILALTLCILTLFLCACQPTPENEPVPNKGDDVMGEKIHTTPVPKTPDPNASEAPDVTEVPFVIPHIDVPEHWNETLVIGPGKVEVKIDADIDYTDCAHPVYIIKNADHFDGATLKKIIDNFVDAEKWRPVDSTRDELIKKLELYMKGEPTGEIDPETGEEIYAPFAEQAELINNVIKKLQEISPEEHWEEIKDIDDIPDGKGYLSDEKRQAYYTQSERTFTIREDRNEHIVTEIKAMQNAYNGSEKNNGIPDPQMPKDNAIRLTEEMLNELGLSEKLCITHIEKAQREEDDEILGSGWLIACSAKVGGAKIYNEHYYKYVSVSNGSDEDFSPFRSSSVSEQLSFYFEDDIIKYIAWSNPKEIIEISNPAVELMPFAEIQERIRKRLDYQYSWFNEEYEYSENVTIREIGLSYLITGKKDYTSEYYWSPMWAVVIEETPKVGTEMPVRPEIVFINAVDGTFVNFN